MSLPVRPQGWHAEIATRLQTGDPAALAELYDATSAMVYAYALQAALSCDDAFQATRSAYLSVWQTPEILGDVRVPVEVRLASLTRRPATERMGPRAAESMERPALGVAF